MPSELKLVIFDLDGTLVDSGQQVASILNEMRIQLGKSALPLDSFTPWLSLGGIQLIQNGLDVPRESAQDLLEKFRCTYLNQPTPGNSIFPNVRWSLKMLADQNIKLHICTNKPRLLAQKVLRELEIVQFFDFMCAGDDLATQKPHPANLLSCLQASKIEPNNACFIGDSIVDQQISINCGVSFGFFKLGNNDGVDIEKISFSFDDFSQLPSFLLT